MNTASTRAYVSKRKLERYQEEKQKRQDRLDKGEPEEEAKFESSGDEVEVKDEETKQVKVVKQKRRRSNSGGGGGFYRARNLSACDNMSDEEVNSDELGSDIGGNRQAQPQ
jgi:hypothetical protein